MEELLLQDDSVLWSLIVGIVAPLAISAIKRSTWSARTQSLVALAVYIVAALGTALFTGAFTSAGNVLSILMVIFLTGWASYSAVWKPTGVDAKIDRATGSPAPSNISTNVTMVDPGEHRTDW
jgi:uncharacterized membrane protein YfhO